MIFSIVILLKCECDDDTAFYHNWKVNKKQFLYSTTDVHSYSLKLSYATLFLDEQNYI